MTTGDATRDVAWRFGPYHLLPTRRQLFVEGRVVALGGRAFDILEALVEKAGQVVPRDELEARVWPRAFVEESSLRVQMGQLRRALGPAADLVVTVPGRGYSFVAGVRRVSGCAASSGAWDLPPRPATFVGRDKAAAALQARVAAHRLVTVVGAGGVGKSALAVAVADTLAPRFPAGVSFVEAAAACDPRLLQVLCADRGRPRLVLLDGGDADIEAAAQAVSRWLAASAGVTVLATSREPLRLPGEQRVRLDPLALPPAGCDRDEARASAAVRLFMDRAPVSPARGASDALAVAALCRRLDGVPLAIEVAAAAGLGATGTCERAACCDRGPAADTLLVDLLDRVHPSLVPRHRSLRASLDWSHQRLAPREREVLRRLAAFERSFSLDQACNVAAWGEVDGPGVAAALGILVAHSLVLRPGVSEGDLYRLHGLTRAHARGHAADASQQFTGCA